MILWLQGVVFSYAPAMTGRYSCQGVDCSERLLLLFAGSWDGRSNRRWTEKGEDCGVDMMNDGAFNYIEMMVAGSATKAECSLPSQYCKCYMYPNIPPSARRRGDPAERKMIDILYIVRRSLTLSSSIHRHQMRFTMFLVCASPMPCRR